eukprot:CAMPEP_0172481622 /NCGR_PEP_ID=MMETSP1066-20121228/7637_1 /TAXON_ID=671091 /ORGANISM="Coscinodiscus wailesii, Strain CCMP2513" /LENGTH=52 /DNA_ID=CAMNT_0013244091 /DNA_START=52 /DNA_END=207 /DNA_ORIENTATION=+
MTNGGSSGGDNVGPWQDVAYTDMTVKCIVLGDYVIPSNARMARDSLEIVLRK